MQYHLFHSGRHSFLTHTGTAVSSWAVSLVIFACTLPLLKVLLLKLLWLMYQLLLLYQY
ncbi:hypothetical protein [Chitinophaga flava]|nr:hypothetical protein [Chitinophaga flava]